MSKTLSAFKTSVLPTMENTWDDQQGMHTPANLNSPRFGVVAGEETPQPLDLGKLALANFSTDSLAGGPTLQAAADIQPLSPLPAPTPKLNPYSPQAYHQRRLSQNTNLSPRGRLPRPKSAIFLDFQHPTIAEDEYPGDSSPLEARFHNTSRLRNLSYIPKLVSFNAYTPKDLGPPIGPPRISVDRSPPRGSPCREPDLPQRDLYSVTNGSVGSLGNLFSPALAPAPSLAPSLAPPDTQLYSPFNFQLQNLSNSNLAAKPAHRRGHKYKHSSVLMNLFTEPPPAAILAVDPLPERPPMPTGAEVSDSLTPSQRLKLGWLAAHFAALLAVFMAGYHMGVPLLSTLAHLMFYDALGLIVVVAVDVMLNFPVWSSLSVAYPFGLGRLEVLVGFALSASLIMVGFDLVSHFVEGQIVEMMAGAAGSPNGADDAHDAVHDLVALGHHIHDHHSEPPSWLAYEAMLLILIAVTLFTTFVVRTDRINQMILHQDAADDPGLLDPETDLWWEAVVKYVQAWARNPTHVLTLTYLVYLVILPLFPQLADMHELMSLVVALLLCTTGWRLVKRLGSILLCLFPTLDARYLAMKSSVVREIEELDFFKQAWKVTLIFIAKFNYDCVVVGMRVQMRGGTADDDLRCRFEINRIIRRQLAGADDVKKMEITVDISRV